MTLWVAMGALTVVALAMLWPAFRPSRRARAPGTDSARLAVFRDRRRELDMDLAAGRIDESRYEETRREIEDAAAMELGTDASARSTVHAPGGRMTAVVVVAIVGVLAWFTYAQIGTPVPPDTGADMHMARDAGDGEFGALVARLAERMAEDPDDLEGWILLGRSRMALGDGAGAVEALRQAERLAPDDASVLADLGEAMLSTGSGEGAGRIERALVLDADQPKALWYGGMLAAERGDGELAALRWRALLELGPPDDLRAVIEDRLAAVGGGAVPPARGGAGPPARGIEVQVSVEAALAAQVRDGATLFVIARDPGNPGGPPLAAVRRGFDPRGMTLRLSDSDTMMPGVELTGRSSLLLAARISTTGTAARNPGDLYGESRWSEGDPQPVSIVIDTVVR